MPRAADPPVHRPPRLGLGRRRFLGGIAGAGVALSIAGPVGAQDIRFFRIATGTTGGTYFPVGGLIASAVSNPPGSRPCDRGGSCGVPGLIAVAQATAGTVENIELLRNGGAEAGFAQADVAFWAYTGTGGYTGRPAFEGLRTIGTLYGEAVQIVTRADAGIRTVDDLKGRVVSLGEEGSGTLVDVRIILRAYGLSESNLQPRFLKPATGADRLAAGEVDAFCIVAGYPVGSVTDAAARQPVRLVAIQGPPAEGLLRTERFFVDAVVPADVYPGVPETRTLSVGAELLVRADLDADVVYGVTRALWHENTRKLLAERHPVGRSMDPARAASDIAVPLHPGAERYYREAGLMRAAAGSMAPGVP